MPPSVEDRLQDILRTTAKIEALLAGLTLDQFADDELLRMAIERYLEIICEASRRLPEAIKLDAPDINWQGMIDFGNILRHAYRSTEAEAVWNIIHNHLPPLKSFVERRMATSGG
ncbi:uncharacterized protein with HEPN domain [Rhodopseudomonas rhenobacensis]|uniref:Uncharacterized protein with HEPN domain n=1 Tax=Rhodopseudomonas rhenobacensis TaxID=87461 RepID=A0A7W8DZE7_9BRAD|nr:HepT-like ribonuclease domain-containing protein [Rhodopseudomonas rhenobacensis]MBB5047777.1 uncharacterized protein with HEPN domain [Rhodopseudomonas rhenobacensis]